MSRSTPTPDEAARLSVASVGVAAASYADLVFELDAASGKPVIVVRGGNRIPASIAVVDESGRQVATYLGTPGIVPRSRGGVDTIVVDTTVE